MSGSLSILSSVLLLLSLSKRSVCNGPCDPLVPEYCGLPYPNSYFTAPSQETATGLKLNLSSAAFPRNNLGVSVSPEKWNTFDGFSPFPSIMAYFADISDSGLPPHWDMAKSLLANCTTILLSADKGERVAHFAELDSDLNLPYSKHALMIWPSQRLEDNSRYIVALRGLKTTSGAPIQPSAAFKALRDRTPSGDSELESRRPHFEDIFKRLQDVGVERSTLQLAWDFSTASLDCLTKWLLFARDDALFRADYLSGVPYHIDTVQDNYNSHIYRRLKGFMLVPLYLSSPFPGSHLVIDKDTDLPVYQGLAPVQFTVLIPHSVANLSISLPLLLQYGHGLFGSQEEVETDYLTAQANTYGYILYACDWWGMAQYDVPAIVEVLNFAPSDFNVIPDRLTQGVVNAHLLMRLMKTDLHKDHLVNLNNSINIDSSLTHYYGNSLGGIIGEVFMASTTDVIRGVLGVAGGPFALLLPRSKDFLEFEVDLRVLYPDPVELSMVISFLNVVWARLEPNAYMSSITENPLKNTPTHRVLYHYSPGDSQVNVLGTYAVARSAGAVTFASNIHCNYTFPNGSGLVTDTLFGLRKVPDDTVLTQDSAVVGFECGAPPNPKGNVPADPSHDTHEGPRRSPFAQQQIDEFIRSGIIRNVCHGRCKC